MAIQIEITKLLVYKIIWIAVSLVLLCLAIGAFFGGATFSEALEFYTPGMFILSFPAGLLTYSVLDSLEVNWMLFLPTVWTVLFVTGYLQWFVLLPAVTDSTITVLRLNEPAVIHNIGTKPTVPSALIAVPQLKTADKRKNVGRKQSFAAFDRQGRTPLQRAIDHFSISADACEKK